MIDLPVTDEVFPVEEASELPYEERPTDIIPVLTPSAVADLSAPLSGPIVEYVLEDGVIVPAVSVRIDGVVRDLQLMLPDGSRAMVFGASKSAEYLSGTWHD